MSNNYNRSYKNTYNMNGSNTSNGQSSTGTSSTGSSTNGFSMNGPQSDRSDRSDRGNHGFRGGRGVGVVVALALVLDPMEIIIIDPDLRMLEILKNYQYYKNNTIINLIMQN